MKKFILLFLFFAASLTAQTKFAMFGDYGCDDPPELAVSILVKSWNPDFIVTLGDNNYFQFTNGDSIDYNIGKYYHAYIKPYIGNFGPGSPTVNRFFPSMGNHDFFDGIFNAPGDIRHAGRTYYNYFRLTDTAIHKGNSPDLWEPAGVRYYTFTKGKVQFFILNSGVSPESHRLYSEPDGIDSNSVQAQWLKSKLSTSTATWKIVVMHHPPYSSVQPGLENAYTALRWNFRQWGATALVCGKNHAYESLVINGLPIFICGLGGEDRNEVTQPIYPGSRQQYVDKYGSIFCQAYNDSLLFKFITVDNDLIDSYKLIKLKNDVGVISANILNQGTIYTGTECCFDTKIKNFGSNELTSLPTKYSVNGVVSAESVSSGLLYYGDTGTVSYCGNLSFIPSAAGNYNLKFFTSLVNDTDHSNDTTTLMITVIDSIKDVGLVSVYQIDSGTVYTGTSVSFSSVIKNFGMVSFPFTKVSYKIEGDTNETSLFSGSLNSNDTSSVIFNGAQTFTPLTSGNYNLKFYTSLERDLNQTNDTLSLHLTVIDSIKDAGVISANTILPGPFYTGANIAFNALVKNFGLANLQSIEVRYKINDDTAKSTLLSGSLNSNDTTTVSFTDSLCFTPAAPGTYVVKMFTTLSGDTNYYNDTASFTLNVIDSTGETILISIIPEGFYNDLTGELNMRDTMKAYLRETYFPYDIVDHAVSVIDSLNFVGTFSFLNAPNGSYYIEIIHRNSIEIWSAVAMLADQRRFAYNFTNDSSSAYGNNLKKVSELPTRFATYSGDVDQDGIIDVADIVTIFNDGTIGSTGYIVTDLDGNQFVDVSDLIIAYNNSSAVITKIIPF